MKKVKVIQKEGAEEIPTEIIAQAIVKISEGIKSLRSGRLNDKALVYLIHKSTGVAALTIKKVLDGIQNLERDYLK